MSTNTKSTLLAAAIVLLNGCAGGQSTRLTSSDLQFTVSTIQAEIGRSEFLEKRNRNSPPAVVAILRAENETLDVLSESERIQLVLDALKSPALGDLSTEKGLRFCSPSSGASTSGATHALSAILNSGVRVGQDNEGFVNARTDTYQMHYAVTDLRTGAIAWEGLVTFRRSAMGRAID